jgi:hypothetical protein
LKKEFDELLTMVRGSSGVAAKPRLNWSYRNPNTGEIAKDHVKLHEYNDLSKRLHGVFHGDGTKITEQAWRKNPNARPIISGDREVYYLKYRNAGFEGGFNGTGKQLDYVKVVVERSSGDIITAFPDYGP